MISKLLESARKGRGGGVRAVSSGAYGGGLGDSRFYGFTQEGLDYNQAAGIRWDNSIVFAILSFAAKQVAGCPIITARMDANGKPVPIQNHVITQLLGPRPNPWYDGSFMATCQVFSEAARGNSYLYMHRSPAKKLVAFEYLPEGTCWPYTQPGSGDWITCYFVTTAEGFRRIPPEDILHLRWMTPNPYWPQLGMSPLEAGLPELVSDKTASRHEAVLLKNSAVSPFVFTPKLSADNKDGEIPEPQQHQIKRLIQEEISGDNKGKGTVLNVAGEIHELGFDPKQLALMETHAHAEERLCALFGAQPVVCGLGTGLRNSNNRASIEGAVDLTFDSFILPYLRHRGAQFTSRLIPELGNPGDVVMYDESRIPAIKERLIRDLLIQTGGPLLTPNEGRGEIGRPPVEGGDVLRQPQKGGFGADTQEDPEADPADNTPAKPAAKPAKK